MHVYVFAVGCLKLFFLYSEISKLVHLKNPFLCFKCCRRSHGSMCPVVAALLLKQQQWWNTHLLLWAIADLQQRVMGKQPALTLISTACQCSRHSLKREPTWMRATPICFSRFNREYAVIPCSAGLSIGYESCGDSRQRSKLPLL